MPDGSDRSAQLEERIAELERIVASRHQPARRWTRIGFSRRLVVIGLMLALVIPAGTVLASHGFSDVPTSNKFHNDIDAIDAANVTHGCGGTRFCPDGLVTRGQMAAFLNRLGALAPGKTPVVNADRLDGLHANQIIRVAEMRETGFGDLPDEAALYGERLSIKSPTDGFVMLTGIVRISGADCDTTCTANAQIRHVQTGALSVGVSINAVETSEMLGTQGVFAVSAGTNSFDLQVWKPLNDAGLFGASGSLTAIFIPFGSTGGSGL